MNNVAGRLNPKADLITLQPGPRARRLASRGRIAILRIAILLILCPGVSSQAFGQSGIITIVAGNQKTGFSGDGGSALSASLNYPAAVAEDSSGNFFVADTLNHRIRKVSSNGTITTIAGNGKMGFSGDGGPATAASLNSPWGIAVDASGNLFIADSQNNRIRKVSLSTGVITTVAGNGVCGYPCISGDGGPATAASLGQPLGIALDASGNLFIADNGNSRIRKVSADGIITVVAGGGSNGLGDGGPATEASLGAWGVAVDASGELFIADPGSNLIRKVSADGIITTVAGNGKYGFSGDGGPATSAELGSPEAVAVDSYGNLFIADEANNRVRRVSPGGVITTVAGGGSSYPGTGGSGSAAGLVQPAGVAVDASGNLLIADSDYEVIQKVSGLTPSVALSPASVSLSVTAGAAASQTITLSSPATGLAWTATTPARWITLTPNSGTAPAAITAAINTASLQPGAYMASIAVSNPLAWPAEESVTVNLTVIPATANLSVSPTALTFITRQDTEVATQSFQIAGTAGIEWRATAVVSSERTWLGISQTAGQIPASLTATVNSVGLAAGTYQGNITVQAPNTTISPATIGVTLTVTAGAGQNGIITTVAGNGVAAFSGDNGPAPSAALWGASGVAVTTAGDLFIADTNNHVVRKVAAASGIITTIAGNGMPGLSGNEGPAGSSSFGWPSGMTMDASGNLFFATGYGRSASNVWKLSAASGVITIVAGGGAQGFSSPGPTPYINFVPYPEPRGDVAVDSRGNIFIADSGNNRILEVSAGGVSATVAGKGENNPGFAGDGGMATSALLSEPQGVALDSSGNIYIADTGNNRIRMVSTSGIITTIAGGGAAGDGGPATAAQLVQPEGLAVDSSGNLFIAESGSSFTDTGSRIRKVSAGIITTIAGKGTVGFSGDGSTAISATLFSPTAVAVDASGNLLIADTGNNVIREVIASGSTVPVPSITPGRIVPIYSNANTIQPGEWISIFGSNLASSTMSWSGDFPTSLGGTSVTINGKPAYLIYVSPTQINLQTPTDSATGPVSVVVTTPGGTATSTVTLAQFGPSFCLLDATHVTAIILRADGSGKQGGGSYDILGPTGNSLGYPTVAAKAGDTVALFAVGLGPTNPAVPAGQAYSGAAQTTNSVSLSINKTNVIPTFAGISSAGLYQINLVVPAGLGTGDVPLTASVGGVQTPAGVVISLQ